MPTGKSNRRRTRFFYMPINISSRNFLSFRQMAPLNQSPWDRTTDETRLTGKKYSTNCTKACVFDIIRPGRKNPTGFWINKFRKYFNNREPLTLEGANVKKFLSHITLHDRVSAATQNQAFNALLYLFWNILQKNLSNLADTVRARQKRRLSVVLTREEIHHHFSFLESPYLLMA